MKKHLFLILLLYINFTRSQSVKSVDSLNVEICNSLVQNKNLNNEVRINTINNLHILPYLSKFNDSIKKEEVFQLVFNRLHKNCNEFVALFANETRDYGWSMQYEKPAITISNEQCNIFNKISNCYYLENDGKKVEVSLTNNLWIEKFSDNTFSKLHYRKKNDCEFELEFIDSNNISRKNISIKGDKYLYKIYNEEKGIYSVYLKNKETYYTFKIMTK